jgi:hypothetical protein
LVLRAALRANVASSDTAYMTAAEELCDLLDRSEIVMNSTAERVLVFC